MWYLQRLYVMTVALNNLMMLMYSHLQWHPAVQVAWGCKPRPWRLCEGSVRGSGEAVVGFSQPGHWRTQQSSKVSPTLGGCNQFCNKLCNIVQPCLKMSHFFCCTLYHTLSIRITVLFATALATLHWGSRRRWGDSVLLWKSASLFHARALANPTRRKTSVLWWPGTSSHLPRLETQV